MAQPLTCIRGEDGCHPKRVYVVKEFRKDVSKCHIWLFAECRDSKLKSEVKKRERKYEATEIVWQAM